MAEIVLNPDRVTDAPEPIKRTVERSDKPNPLLPVLEASWAARSKRNGSETETGSTKQYRSYSADETMAVVRALRRGSDKLGIGVRIVAPQTSTPATNEDGTPKLGKDGKQRQTVKYRAGTIIFETHTRQQRARKDAEDSTDAPEGTESAEGAGDTEDAPESAESTDDQGASEEGAGQQDESGWQ